MPSGAAPAGIPSAADILYHFVPASGAQYAAGAQFSGIYSVLQDDVFAACMARSGFRLPRTSAAAYVAQDFDNSQWPDLAAISRAGMLDPGLLYGPPEVSVPSGQVQSYQAASTRCGNAQDALFAPVERAGDALLNPWLGIASGIQDSPQVRSGLAGFASCVERAGTPASSATSFNDFLAWETGLETAAADQAGRLAVDRHWAPVFVRCARSAVAVQNRLELAAQATYLREHRPQVQALESAAQRVVASVERQYGRVGLG